VLGAQLEDFGSGLTPVTQGWFVVNVRDAEWWFSERRGARCAFESEYGDPPVEFAQFGINVTVLEPGQTGLYHAESNQEAFLVLSGSARCSSRTRSDACGPGTSSTLLRGPSTPSWAPARGRV
jgi:mannose-6-phosphate isomerase-like protein (cupin superfamily)